MSLALYKPLGDNDEKTRLDAAKQLSAELAALVSGDRDDATKKQVDYALNRLTKGIASGRDSARPGFAVVLTELLTVLQSGENPTKWDISLDHAIATVVKNTTQHGHTTGQEERDFWLGRLFGLQSLVQSNILFTSEEALEKYPAVLDLLFEVAQKKPWLMESSAWTIASSVLRWPAVTAAKAAEITYKKLAESGLSKSGEGVGIWLALQAHQPSVTPPKDVWSKGSPLLTANLATLAKVLKESGSKEGATDGAKVKGSWNPKLGFVWDFVLNIYFSDEPMWKSIREAKHKPAEWSEFWRVVVDESLYSSSSSEERKFWGFLFFLKSLDRVSTADQLTAMFSKNFMRCMINQLADSERYLNKAAVKTSRALIAKAESAPWTAPVVFRQLATNNGTPNFDHLTKSKTIDKVLCSADESGLVTIMDELRGIIANPLASTPDVEDAEKIAEVRRQWAADQILSIIRNGKTVKAESWLRKVINIFTTFGYYEITDKKKKPAVPVTATSQAMFRARLMSCLTNLISLKDAKEGGSESWPYMAIKTIAELGEKKNSYRFVVEFDEAIGEALDKSTKTIEKLRKKRAADLSNIQLLSFELLYSLVTLQVYNGESDALSVLEDLQSIQKKILGSEKKASSKKSKKVEEEEDDLEMDPSEVLVDILLSFLSKPSMLLKRLAQTVFTSFCGSITRGGLERCFEILETKEGLDGQAELYDNEDDEEEDDDEEHNHELDSDVEMVDGGMDVDEGAESDDSDIEIMSASEDEDEGADAATVSRNEEEARKLEAALQKVLDMPANDSDSDADLPMDDEAMMALDVQISSIFAKRKAQANKKHQKKEARELIVNFKAKILELLEIFVKTAPRSALALETLLPCLVLARASRDQKLQEKALNAVRTFSHSSKREGLPLLAAAEDVERAWALLAHVHEEATRGGPRGRKAACSSASILVVKTLVAHDTEALERVAGIYSTTMVRWVQDPKLGVDNSFFTDFVGWAGSVRGKLGKEEDKEDKEEVVVTVGNPKKGGNKKAEKRKRAEAAEAEDSDVEEPAAKAKTGKKKNKRRNKGGKN